MAKINPILQENHDFKWISSDILSDPFILQFIRQWTWFENPFDKRLSYLGEYQVFEGTQNEIVIFSDQTQTWISRK